MRDVTFY